VRAGFNFHALEARLRSHVLALAAEPRAPGSQRHREAALYIREHFKKAGFVVAEPPAGQRFHNVTCAPVPDGRKGPLIICGAHYDSLEETPGADDNASGVAALLELARWIGPRISSAEAGTGQLQLIAYDMEEYGMFGSAAHSMEMRARGVAVRGMIALEMLGYTDLRPGSQNLPAPLRGLYPSVANFIGVCGNLASRSLVDAVSAGLRRIPDLPVEAIAVPGRGESLPDIRRSDHSQFWDRGFPALMITDTSFFRNPNYHRGSDTPGTLDYSFLARVTAGVCEAVLQLVSERS
jgi:Zn-dependent M28 family amino/carboxypeptidase